MAVPSNINFRDLNQVLELHQVTSSPATDTELSVWGRFYASFESAANFVVFNAYALDQATNNDWRYWYFVYAGDTWIITAFKELFGGKLLDFTVSSTASFSGSVLSNLDTYASDVLAAAGGVAVGGYYRAGAGHERADIGSVTSRLS